jgi:TPR repeat protein/beta-lactamase regulating signal transducer with metallopeptidase domain
MMNAALAHLWQSTLFAGLAALLTLAFRKNRASTRYCIWLAASVKFLIPMSPLVAAAHNLTAKTASIELAPRLTMLADLVVSGATVPAATRVPLTPVSPGSAAVNFAAILLALWACGAAAAFAWWLLRWLRMRAVLRASSPLPCDAPIPVRSSAFLLEPGLFGIFHPVIVLPESIVPALSPRQLQAILEHELSHWRRCDNLTAALHMLVEALFWFHPLVWWIGRRLVVEREQACDEAVIQSLCDRQAYAEAILKICQGYSRQPMPCIAGVAGGDLKRRIATIMTAQVGERLRIVKKLVLAGVTCAAIAAPVAAGMIGAWRAAAGNLEDGLGAFDHGDYRFALAKLRPLANQGNAAAQDRIGQMYDRGRGVTLDYVQAAAWYRKAAMQGDPAGQQGLSIMYSLGHGVPQDSLAASLWARQNLLHFIETPCDPKLMFETESPSEKAALQAAAERNDPQAAAYLGSLYEAGFPEQSVDHVKALKWISKAAEQGNAKGEAALASMYLAGFAVPPNGAAAVTWMRKAAEQGLERAQCSLAVMYDQGIGVAQDHTQAAKSYRGLVISTDRGGVMQDWARMKLAIQYETGDGIPRDDEQAVAWLRSAADHGYPFAETRLGIRYANGNVSERDYGAAIKLLDSAAKKGMPAAQIALGNLYADGHGVSQNLIAAYKWFELAARYSTSPTERNEARKDREAISARMTHHGVALAERLVERWLPADEIGDRMHAGGDM